MPEDFIKCVNAGGKVVTEKKGKNKYQRICYDKKGKRYEGEVKTKKSASRSRRRWQKHDGTRKKIKESRDLVEELKKLEEHFNQKRI